MSECRVFKGLVHNSDLTPILIRFFKNCYSKIRGPIESNLELSIVSGWLDCTVCLYRESCIYNEMKIPMTCHEPSTTNFRLL